MFMNSVICTLFEGSYHYGVAALVNSLFCNGFRGSVYAGFRGTLPTWANSAKESTNLEWKGAKTFDVTDKLQIHFLPLDTEYHLTNYKPDLMLKLINGPAQNAECIYYFDPDIVLSAPWTFLEEWVDCGIALCEDINSPLAEFHPRRVAWRRYFEPYGVNLFFKSPIYVNGGFIGVKKDNYEFINKWKSIQELMSEKTGGLNNSQFASSQKLPQFFDKTDQDALNITIEVWDGNTSLLCNDGMAFKSQVGVMYHAIGQPKPWSYNPLYQILKGNPPNMATKSYFKVVNYPIVTTSIYKLFLMNLFLKIAIFLGRFYRRN